MAIPAVKVMVKDILPYLSDAGNDAAIERFRTKVVYLMQGQTLKTDLEVEVEANYNALQNMLFAKMVAYQMLKTKAVQTMAGDGTAGSTGGAKVLKKAKADVTEAEFVVTKAEDGSTIQMKTTDLLASLLDELCAEANMLSYTVPWCACLDTPDLIPPFIVGDDYPPNCADPTNFLFSGSAIGM